MSDDNDMTLKDAQGCLWQILLFPGMAAYLTFADGYVMSRLWAWHAVPLGMRPLHWHVFAAGMLAYNVVRAGTGNRQKDTRSAGDQAAWIFIVFATPWVALWLGWWWS